MNSLEIRNRKIIDAVIRKEQAVCPGAIALIGIYGWRTIWQGLVLERNAGKGKYESEVILSWHLFTVPYKRTSGKME